MTLLDRTFNQYKHSIALELIEQVIILSYINKKMDVICVIAIFPRKLMIP